MQLNYNVLVFTHFYTMSVCIVTCTYLVMTYKGTMCQLLSVGPRCEYGVTLITARKRSLGQGNIFTPVCHSVHRGGGVCGCSGGGCVRGCLGGVHGCSGGGGVRGIRRHTEIRSMSGRYASYWNAFLWIKVCKIISISL